MKELFWKAVAWLVTRESICNWLIAKAICNPWYGIEGIMERYWIFNPYFEKDGNGGEETKRSKFWDILPTIRLHYIYGADTDPHLHDHPWDCRTIILRGWYIERVENIEHDPMIPDSDSNRPTRCFLRGEGFTRPFNTLDWHKIELVPMGHGTWTMFITWKYQGPWGFLVDGKKMLSRDYFEYRKQWRE